METLCPDPVIEQPYPIAVHLSEVAGTDVDLPNNTQFVEEAPSDPPMLIEYVDDVD